MTRRSPNKRKRSCRQAGQTSPSLSDFGRAVEAATALAEVGRELVGTLDPGRVTHLIVDAVVRLLRSRSAALYQVVPESAALRCLAVAGGGDARQWVGKILPAGHGVVGRAVSEGRTIWSPDFLAEPNIPVPDWLRERARETGHRSVVGVPLVVRGATIGALSLGDAPGRVMSGAELELLRAFADQAALALENARLFAESERGRQTAQALVEVARVLAQELDPDLVSQRIADSLRTLMGALSVALYRLEPDSGDLVSVALSTGVAPVTRWVPELRRGTGLAGLAIRERRPLATPNVLVDPRITLTPEVRDRLAHAPHRAVLAVPLLAGDRVIGALGIGDREGRLFTDEEIRLAQAFADQAALAFRNVRLFAHEQAARAEAEATTSALQASEERYRVLVEGSLQGMYIHQDRLIQFANEPMARIFGYASPEDLIGQDYLILIAPQERTRIEAYRAARLRGERAPTRYETQGVAKDGTPIRIEVLVSIIPWHGRPAVLGTFLDITERRQAQEALERLSHQHELILTSAGEGIFGQDPEGLATFVNPAAAALLGWPPEELVGRPMHPLLHHSRRDGTPYPRAECPIYAAFREGTMQRGEHEVFWRRDGTSFPVEYTCTPVRAKDGELIGSVVTFRDVSEREQLEAQIRQAQKMEAIGRLAGGIAHDFNNLLTVIKGRSELLRRRLRPDAIHSRDFDLIKRTADRAAALVRQLLAFSRTQLLEPRTLDLSAVVAEMSTMLRRMIGEQIELQTPTDPAPGHVKADLVQIEQVLVNLAVNARDAMPEGGRLTLRTTSVELDEAFTRQLPGLRPGPYVRLTVSDTGIGMDRDTQGRVFEPFFTTKAPGKGSGLGLSTVYGIVKQSGGSIAVESVPGRGSTFTIYLPRVEEAVDSRPAAGSASPAAPHRPATILVVDDDEAVREVARDLLVEHGYSVLEAADGPEALRLCEGRQEPIDLLLTDVVMPGMTGIELGRRVTALRSDARVLHMSGHMETEIAPDDIRDAGGDFLPKPFAPDALLTKVQAVLEGRSRRPQVHD